MQLSLAGNFTLRCVILLLHMQKLWTPIRHSHNCAKLEHFTVEKWVKMNILGSSLVTGPGSLPGFPGHLETFTPQLTNCRFCISLCLNQEKSKSQGARTCNRGGASYTCLGFKEHGDHWQGRRTAQGLVSSVCPCLCKDSCRLHLEPSTICTPPGNKKSFENDITSDDLRSVSTLC